jgi:DNA-binding response OmpR family regulator
LALVPTYLGKVLLIDDDLARRLSLAEALRAQQWLVETATGGRAGLDAAMKAQPDAVVTDLVLSDIASLSFARSLRTFIEHDVVIVGLSAELETLDSQARAAGFDEVFTNPVDVAQLHAHLTGAMNLTGDLDERATNEIERIRR